MKCKQNWPKDVKRIHHARQTLHVLHNFEIDENYIQIEYSYTWMLTFIEVKDYNTKHQYNF